MGTPFTILNLYGASLVTGVEPEALDWVVFGYGNLVWAGVLCALIPGSACNQHYALRSILWAVGVAPASYKRFLNYATERMLLQRVGGSYRFIHPLLQDFFSGMRLIPDDRSLSRGTTNTR